MYHVCMSSSSCIGWDVYICEFIQHWDWALSWFSCCECTLSSVWFVMVQTPNEKTETIDSLNEHQPHLETICAIQSYIDPATGMHLHKVDWSPVHLSQIVVYTTMFYYNHKAFVSKTFKHHPLVYFSVDIISIDVVSCSLYGICILIILLLILLLYMLPITGNCVPR